MNKDPKQKGKTKERVRNGVGVLLPDFADIYKLIQYIEENKVHWRTEVKHSFEEPGFCYIAPAVPLRGRKKGNSWVFQRLEFGLTKLEIPRSRPAHYILYLHRNKLSMDTELQLKRTCKTQGCLNPAHYERSWDDVRRADAIFQAEFYKCTKRVNLKERK